MKSTYLDHFRLIKKYKVAVTFLTGYNGIFNVTNSNEKFLFTTSFSDIEPSFNVISPGVYELESLDAEIKRICFNDGYFGEDDYPFKIQPKFSTLGSIIEIDVGIARKISFLPNDCIRDLLGFKPNVKQENNNLSDFPVDILSFDNIFLESDSDQGMIFRGKRSEIIHNFTMDVDLGYKCIDKFGGGVQWYVIHSKDVISSINFESKNENKEIVSLNGKSITIRLSIKEINFVT